MLLFIFINIGITCFIVLKNNYHYKTLIEKQFTEMRNQKEPIITYINAWISSKVRLEEKNIKYNNIVEYDIFKNYERTGIGEIKKIIPSPGAYYIKVYK